MHGRGLHPPLGLPEDVENSMESHGESRILWHGSEDEPCHYAICTSFGEQKVTVSAVTVYQSLSETS